MKSLNDVIAEMEYEAEYNSGEWRDIDAEALYHLKEYQEMLNNVENDPLEWEEIRIIGKKPIWVEYHGMNRWVIPEEYRHDVIGREYILVQDGGMLFRFQQHDVWEAYRKERK